MDVGRITFGPAATTDAARDWRQMKALGLTSAADCTVHACNCIGPQPGQTKCPCRLRGESQQGARMVRDGIVIDGREYDLVPRRK